jgi:hypothetical protein
VATLQDIRDFTRNTLQTDSTDLPDSLVDVFANESVSRVLGLRDDWPHLYSEGTLSMVTGDGIYSLSSGSFTPTTFRTIESVWDDAPFGRSLMEMDYQGAAAAWIGPSASITSDPYYFSVYGGNLYLWPIPNATRTLRIGGYREPNVMSAGSDQPDLPIVFHAAIQYGTCSIAYAQQEDPELAQFWRNMANESVGVAIRNLFMNSRHRPIMLWGKGQYYHIPYEDWVRRNV